MPSAPIQAARIARDDPRLGYLAARHARRPLGRILVARGAIRPADLMRALALRAGQDCRVGDILLARGMVTRAELRAALEEQWACRFADLELHPPDAELTAALGAEFCLFHQAVPWSRTAGGTVFACARPERFEELRRALPARFGEPSLALCHDDDIHRALLSLELPELVRAAETRSPPEESCRGWNGGRLARRGLACAALLAVLAASWPVAVLVMLHALAAASVLGFAALKAAAAAGRLLHARGVGRGGAGKRPPPPVLPRVSLLVPLFREEDIASQLLRRLRRLDYPAELLDICLVVEADDRMTRDTIAATELPPHIRMISVPKGELRTKPRAMNYALDFCKGSIVGILDAEDAPAPDQVREAVGRFHESGPEVACLQGVLDYYNARTNWLSRCFTIEYAAWFRVVLPGLEKLGLIMPLGGTTVFLRREALVALGGWDAHNVTEDADLGVRLARHGYRTEMLASVTEEEANCRPVPWIKQRSRWLKGFALTWAVHMRRPGQFLGQVGWRRFLGLQAVLLGTLGQFLFAPLLWSLWLIVLGLPHPLSGLLPPVAAAALAGLFAVSEFVSLMVAIIGVSGRGHRFLLPWTLTMHLYYPLGTLAALKGLFELLHRPFYWDKTRHGLFAPTAARKDARGG